MRNEVCWRVLEGEAVRLSNTLVMLAGVGDEGALSIMRAMCAEIAGGVHAGGLPLQVHAVSPPGGRFPGVSVVAAHDGLVLLRWGSDWPRWR